MTQKNKNYFHLNVCKKYTILDIITKNTDLDYGLRIEHRNLTTLWLRLAGTEGGDLVKKKE